MKVTFAYCPPNINFICKHELQNGNTHLPLEDFSLMLVSTGWEAGFGFLHNKKFLLQQDGKADLDSYTEQNSCHNRIGRRIWIPTQYTILVTTEWEDGFTNTVDSYTAQISCVNRVGRRIWIPNQHKILVITG